MRKLILAVAVLALVLVAAAVAATTVFSVSGSTSWGQQLSGSFTTAQTEDLTATVLFVGKPNGQYVLHLYQPWTDPNNAFVCFANVDATVTSASCTIVGAPAGQYVTDFYPIAGRGKISASIVVTTP